MKINEYEAVASLQDNDNFIVETSAGTRKASASLVRNMKINDYEPVDSLQGDDNFVVETDEGTRKVSASLVRSSLNLDGELTYAQYQSLPEEKKKNGTYWIKDVNSSDVLAFFPDYANRGTIYQGTTTSANVVNVNGTATQDMYIQAMVNTKTVVGLPFIRITLDNVIVYEAYKYGDAKPDNYVYRWSPMFPIKKGTSYKIELSADVAGASVAVYKYNIV